jgi:hypothetical protein
MRILLITALLCVSLRVPVAESSSRCAQEAATAIRKLTSPSQRSLAPREFIARSLLDKSITVAPPNSPFQAKGYLFNIDELTRLQPFEKMNDEELTAVLKNQFFESIQTGLGQLSPQEIRNLQETARDFAAQGGQIVIDRNIDPRRHYNATFDIEDDGQFGLRIPFIDLLGAAADIERVQKRVAKVLVHELRHYVTYMRVVRSLQRKGMSEIEARKYLWHLHERDPEGFNFHIDQFEQEAKAIERKAIPQSIEQDFKPFIYADVDAFQRWINDYLADSKVDKRANWMTQKTAIRLADRIAAQAIEFLAIQPKGSEISPFLKQSLERYSAAMKFSKTTAMANFSEDVISEIVKNYFGNFDLDFKKNLRSLLSERLRLQRRQLQPAIRHLLEQ